MWKKAALATTVGFSLVATLLFPVMVAGPVQASILSVPQTYTTIQDAINAARNGDTVLVSPGEYNEHVVISGKYITIKGNGPIGSVVLRPNSSISQSALFIQGVPWRHGMQTVVSGLTITGGVAPAGQGGGITVALNASPLIERNEIVWNTASEYGGGISVHSNSNPIIRDNVISHNFAHRGGGGIFAVNNSSPTIVNNQIAGNRTAGAAIVNGGSSGGGVYLENTASPSERSSPVLFGNTIVDNSAEFAGGGVMLRTGVDAIVEENTISGNSAAYGGGIHVETTGSAVTIARNSITANKAVAAPQFNGSGYGGGISSYDKSVVRVTENQIRANSATAGGAGLTVAESSFVTADRNVIASNVTSSTENSNGGGVYVAMASFSAENNEIVDNSAKLGGGIALLDGAFADIRHNSIVGNSESRHEGGAIFVRGDDQPHPVVANVWSNIVSHNEGFQIFDQGSTKVSFRDNLFTEGGANAAGRRGIYFSYLSGSLSTVAELNARANVDGSIVDDPGFVDIGARNLSLTAGSSAIDRVSAATSVDLRGLVRDHLADIGAREYGANKLVSPVYRFWSHDQQSHFFTANAEERRLVLRSYNPLQWKYEFVAFGGFVSPTEQTIPIYRFWSDEFRGHFYTASEAEKVATEQNFEDRVWRYEGTGFFAYPLGSTTSGDRVYRFWSPDNRHHFYTASAAERDHIIRTYPLNQWTYEGEQFSVPRF